MLDRYYFLRALARKGEGQKMVEPLSLKARSGPGGGEAAGGATGGVSMALSRAWAVKKTQRGIYTGGKVRSKMKVDNKNKRLGTYLPLSSFLSSQTQVALLVPPPPLGEVGAEAVENELVVTMYGSDVILSNVKNGQVVAIISCGEGEVRLSFRLLCFVCSIFGSCVPSTIYTCTRRSRGLTHSSIACPGQIVLPDKTHNEGIGCERSKLIQA